jgi:hypothetical protein
LKEKIRQIIHMSVSAQNYVSAAPAVTAIGSTLRHKFFSPKADRTTPAAACLRKNLKPIDKHY